MSDQTPTPQTPRRPTMRNEHDWGGWAWFKAIMVTIISAAVIPAIWNPDPLRGSTQVILTFAVVLVALTEISDAVETRRRYWEVQRDEAHGWQNAIDGRWLWAVQVNPKEDGDE